MRRGRRKSARRSLGQLRDGNFALRDTDQSIRRFTNNKPKVTASSSKVGVSRISQGRPSVTQSDLHRYDGGRFRLRFVLIGYGFLARMLAPMISKV